MLQKKNSIALSNIARQRIMEIIEENNIQIDEKIPSEVELMKIISVSRYTIREALAILTEEQILYKVQGKGTYLKKKPIQIKSGLERLESVTETIKSFNYTPGTKFVGAEITEPTEDMIKKLQLEPYEKVITFKRIRTADDKVAAYCIDTFPLQRLGGKAPEKFESESMFQFIEEKFHIYIESSVSSIIPAFPTDEMLNVLHVSSNDLFILLQQIHYDREGRPTIYSLDYFNSTVFQFIINRTRRE